MNLKKILANICGLDNVVDNPEILENYSKDQSFVRFCMPDIIVKPGSTVEVQEIVKVANKFGIPITPYSSGLNLRGAAIPSAGGLILDLSRMKEIKIDAEARLVSIEPGVNYELLQEKLSEIGFRIMVPLAVPAKRSVLSSYLERDPVCAAASFEIGNDLILNLEVVLPSGEIFKTGSWSIDGEAGGPWGPVGQAVYKFWTGAQGTFGVVTKMAVKIEPMPQKTKIMFFVPEDLERAVTIIKKIQNREIGIECFGLNRFNLAALLEKEWVAPEKFPSPKVIPSVFNNLKKKLPSWIFLVCIVGFEYFPEDKVCYEENIFREICMEEGVEPLSTLPGHPELEEVFSELMIYPWRRSLLKYRYKGSCQSISFHSPLTKIGEYENTVYNMAKKRKYALEDVGAFVLIVERGRAAYMEFDFPCDLENNVEVKDVQDIWEMTSEILLDQGVYIERPYGKWASMVYPRYNSVYVKKLKELKSEIDPNNIMNPGKLCFQINY